MHFAKTYHQLLVSLPPELRDHAFDYRKLKRLINRTAFELDSLGLGPSVLRPLHNEQATSEDGSFRDDTSSIYSEFISSSDASHRHSIAYEIVSNSSTLEPRLRLSSPDLDSHHDTASPAARPIYHVDLLIPEQSSARIIQTLRYPPDRIRGEPDQLDHLSDRDMVIPLPSDTEFFQLLTTTLSALADHCDTLQHNFKSALASLAASISSTALPASSSAPRTFTAYSSTKRNIVSLVPSRGGKSDLCTWREIFQLYAEAEVFESFKESTPGERDIEEVEKRLELFKRRVLQKKASLILPGSRDAFDTFLQLNLLIFNVKRLQFANSEATRKILKKHAKRTTLPIPLYLLEFDASSACYVSLITHPSKTLPRLLVQAIGEILLPVVPHIDDYTCLICTFIAFKPVRLSCGHFFCVRCLVKMQRRHMMNCPMCRTPTVLRATPSNIDYGLLNLMIDWFPVESREKFRTDEREVTREQLEALGIENARACRIM